MEDNEIKKYSLNDILKELSEFYQKVSSENDIMKKLNILDKDIVEIHSHITNNDLITTDDIKIISNKLMLIQESVFKYIVKNKDTNLFCGALNKYLEWQPYINRYKVCLNQIEELLTVARKYIDKNINKWQNLSKNILSKPMQQELLIRQCDSYEKIIACSLIRYIIELVLELQVLNNVKYVKKPFQKKSIYSYFKHFDKCKIDWKIKTLIVNKCFGNKYFYYVDEIWNDTDNLKKKIWGKLLSSNIHNQEKKYPMIDYINLVKTHEEVINYGEEKLNELVKIAKVLNDLYFTLKDHVVFIENGELVLIVKDFKVFEEQRTESLVKKASDYEFEEVPNESKENLYKENL